MPPVSAGGYVLQKMLGDQQGRHTIHIGAPERDELVFFTDGSCTDPTIPLCRRASWAVLMLLMKRLVGSSLWTTLMFLFMSVFAAQGAALCMDIRR